jgi:hypothetical protein
MRYCFGSLGEVGWSLLYAPSLPDGYFGSIILTVFRVECNPRINP